MASAFALSADEEQDGLQDMPPHVLVRPSYVFIFPFVARECFGVTQYVFGPQL